eukprot:TRINITY_DN340_c1_g1_i1.p1 TRINITY_DN340_c1_g1~~TRINITY_DN340_c1_g1_i1.p1  ORF type:complete len:129 (-),score=11.72 TRINITY_DN340_c1_g1_i1:320-706(-)
MPLPIPTVSNPVIVKVISPGDGKTYPTQNSFCTIHYTGKLIDNGQKTFDSSLPRKPFSFQVGKGQVIAGLDSGIESIALGGKGWIYIHHSYAYAEKSMPGPDMKNPEKNALPAFSSLKFKVKVLSVKD